MAWTRFIPLLFLAGFVGGYALAPMGSEAVANRVPQELKLGSLISGPVTQVIDGDTFEIDGHRIRLFGVDTPEDYQECEKAGKAWDCGVVAQRAVESLVHGKEVDCLVQDFDREEDPVRPVATCFVGKEDIGHRLAIGGNAVAYTEFTDRYVLQVNDAKANRRGIYDSRFTTPSVSRDHSRAPIYQPQPEGAGECSPMFPVRANVNGKKMIYHVSGQQHYETVKMTPEEGDTCFATPAAAEAAGFRPAKR